MHYHAEIWIPENTNVKKQIKAILTPFDEDLDWDWWQIGGRWTGYHTNYTPYKDYANVKTCSLCNRTGFRTDTIGKEARKENPSYTCNGCGEYNRKTKKWTHGYFGPGKCLQWPTQWVPCIGDVISVSKIKEALSCYTLIVKDKIFHTEIWTGETFTKTEFDGNVKKQLENMNIKNGFLVTVDYHT